MTGANQKERGISSYSKKGKVYWRIDVWLELPDGSRRRKQVSDIPNIDLARKLRNKLKADAFEARHFQKPRASTLTLAAVWKAYAPTAELEKRSWECRTHPPSPRH